MDKFLNSLVELGTTVGSRLLLGLVILFVGLKVSKWIIKILVKGRVYKKMEISIQHFIASFLKVVLYAVVISSACIVWGVPSTSFMTIFASAGVAIGLALQGALSNFAGGLMILFFKPFKVGDYIESGSASGTVTDITIIYTILTTVDNKVITVPNGSLTNSNVTNYSTKPERRVDLTISADYDADIEKVKSVLLSVVNSHDKIIKTPEPFVRLASHSASSLDYTVRVWCKSSDYWDVKFDLLEEIRKAFAENGISIPFQQIQISNRDAK